jgi:3-hydroxy-9,10-secoandrosta-1,3,5(10)-triene-9,17-dione monooxygenase
MAIMQDRVSTNTGKASKADPILHAALARAIAEKGEMETTLRLTFDELMGYAERGEPIPMEKRAFSPTSLSTVVRRLAGLIDDIVQLLGGGRST